MRRATVGARSAPLPTQLGGGGQANGPIRVMLVDGQGLFREALGLILGLKADVKIVGEVSCGIQTIDVIHDVKPDVVLLAIASPGMEGIGLIRAMKQQSPQAKPLLLTAATDEALIFKALRAGAKGYVPTSASLADLRKAIRRVHEGDVWIERKLILRFLGDQGFAAFRGDDARRPTEGPLTAREQEILRLLAFGGTNKDIAQALSISEKTVKTHLNNIFRKLNVTRRLQAVLYAIQQRQR